MASSSLLSPGAGRETFLKAHIAVSEVVDRQRFKSASMRKPGRTRQEVIQLKSPILLKLGINVGFGE